MWCTLVNSRLRRSLRRPALAALVAVCVAVVIFPDRVDGRNRRSHACRETKLEDREEMANVVFTGTVERLYRKRGHVSYQGVVRVKRVLKGDYNLADNKVIVEGFGDPHICYSDVKERDTRIFLVSQDGSGGHLKLNSSLVRVSLNNLEHVMSAVKSDALKMATGLEQTLPQLSRDMTSCEARRNMSTGFRLISSLPSVLQLKLVDLNMKSTIFLWMCYVELCRVSLDDCGNM